MTTPSGQPTTPVLKVHISDKGGIATLRPVKTGDFRAIILFDGYLLPVEFYRQASDVEILQSVMAVLYPDVRFVTTSEFQTELDFLRIFGVNSQTSSMLEGGYVKP